MDCVKELLIILAKQCMTQESAMLQLVVCMFSELTLKKVSSFPHWVLGYIFKGIFQDTTLNVYKVFVTSDCYDFCRVRTLMLTVW